MKNKGFWLIMVIYIVFFVLDMWSTLRMGLEKASILEANPIFHYVGFPGLILINGLAILLFWGGYCKQISPSLRYVIITTMFFIILARLWAIQNNLAVGDMDLTIEQAKTIATVAVKQETVRQLAIITYSPMIANLITFFVWRWDHAVTTR